MVNNCAPSFPPRSIQWTNAEIFLSRSSLLPMPDPHATFSHQKSIPKWAGTIEQRRVFYTRVASSEVTRK